MSAKADQSDPSQSRPGDDTVDYGGLYRDYWSRPDRWGSHSFADPEAIADQLLHAFGQGKTLDVGCGMGLLVRTLLRRGIDAHGIDVAAAPVEHASTICPSRFQTGSILELPFADASFDTICSTDVLEHIAENDVPKALAELHRVCTRGVFIRLAVTPDRDRIWHLTVRDRQWWEQRFFDAGFERHPLAFRVVPYESIDGEGWQVTLVLAKAIGDANAPTRDASEHAELLCALTARCQSAIRPNDRVLFIGDPSLARMLSGGCNAASVETIEPERLADLPADSAEAIVAFEPVDSLHAARVLTPTGRLALCAAAAHANASIEHPLVLEQALVRDPDARAIRSFDDSKDNRPDLVLLARTPLGGPAAPYQERVYQGLPDADGFHVASYERDHDNPWLLRWMISIGLRSTNDELVIAAANDLLEGEHAARRGSADEGAAICVLGYRLLEPVDPDPAIIDAVLARIDQFDNNADDTAHAWRWRVSNRYLAGLLQLARGRLDLAEQAFLACSEMDALRFSPLLASKTIDACFQAGLLAMGRGDADVARERYRTGLGQLEAACKADWLNVWGDPNTPLPFGLPDLNSAVELAARCAFALGQIDNWSDRPGLAWQQTSRRTLSDLRRWVQRLTDSRQHLDRERGRLRELALARQDRIEELKQQLEQLRARLERSTDAISLRDRAAVELRAHIEDRARAIEHLTRQLEQREQRIDELQQHIDERRDAIERLQTKLAEREARIDELTTHAGDRTSTIEHLQARVAERDERIEQLASHLAERKHAIESLQSSVADRDNRIEELTAHAAERAQSIEHVQARLAERDARVQQLSDRLSERRDAIDALQQQIAQRDERIAALTEHAADRARAIEHLTARADRSEARVVELLSHAAAQARAIDHLRDAQARGKDRTASLERTIADRRDALEHQRSRISMLEARIAELTQQIAKLNETQRWQAEQLKLRGDSNTQLRAHADRVTAERDRLLRDVATLRAWSADLLAATRSRTHQASAAEPRTLGRGGEDRQ